MAVSCGETALSSLQLVALEAHPGVTRMKRLARTLVWWPGIDHDIEQKVKSCPECQINQASPPEAPLQPWRWPTRPWSRLHVDFAGPFMGHMFLILIDAHSKWIEAHSLPSITSTTTIQCLRRIFATFGLPDSLVTDNGPSFVSHEFEQSLQLNGIRHKTSPPYHPSSNGLAERAVQIFKRGMKKMKGSLQDRISRFLFAYRNTPQSTTDASPAELLLGRKMRTVLDLVKPDLHKRVESEQDRQKDNHDKHSKHRSFTAGDRVFAKNFTPGSSTLWLPGQVLQSTGSLSFKIQLSDGRIITRHMDHIRQRTDRSEIHPEVELTSTMPLTAPDPVPETTSDPESSQVEDHTPASAETVSESRRYPARVRRPPDFYGPIITY